jgi:hypothetical protein
MNLNPDNRPARRHGGDRLVAEGLRLALRALWPQVSYRRRLRLLRAMQPLPSLAQSEDREVGLNTDALIRLSPWLLLAVWGALVVLWWLWG